MSKRYLDVEDFNEETFTVKNLVFSSSNGKKYKLPLDL